MSAPVVVPPECALPNSPLSKEKSGIDACVHCGFCLQSCPTYLTLEDENDSPRGRIVLMHALVEGTLPVTDRDRVTVRYDSAFALMHDLRRMGSTNVLIDRLRRPLGRTTLMRMAEIYRERFADPDGRVRATFEIVWLSGWAPHASQQQPLKPGSAAARLADALGTREISTGVKAGD